MDAFTSSVRGRRLLAHWAAAAGLMPILAGALWFTSPMVVLVTQTALWLFGLERLSRILRHKPANASPSVFLVLSSGFYVVAGAAWLVVLGFMAWWSTPTPGVS